LALGAPRGQIVARFLKQGLFVSALGCIAGLALAAAFNQVLAGMLYGVSPSDGITLSAVILMVLLVTGTAYLLPSVRASRVDPMQVLRESRKWRRKRDSVVRKPLSPHQLLVLRFARFAEIAQSRNQV